MGSLATYFAATFAIAWIGFAAAAALSASDTPAAVRQVLFLPGVFAPAIAALWLTWRKDGEVGIRALLRQVGRWRVAARWYAFAIGFMVAVKLTAALLHRLITNEWPQFGDQAWYLLLASTIVSTPFQAGEEVGWRGFALPRLAARVGPAAASIILGVIWAAWHLPLFFIADTTTTAQSFPLYLLQVTAFSVAIAWLYWKTDGSLLLTMLFHAAINNTKDIVPSGIVAAEHPFTLTASPIAWLTVGVLWITAVYLLLQMPRGGLRRCDIQ